MAESLAAGMTGNGGFVLEQASRMLRERSMAHSVMSWQPVRVAATLQPV